MFKTIREDFFGPGNVWKCWVLANGSEKFQKNRLKKQEKNKKNPFHYIERSRKLLLLIKRIFEITFPKQCISHLRNEVEVFNAEVSDRPIIPEKAGNINIKIDEIVVRERYGTSHWSFTQDDNRRYLHTSKVGMVKNDWISQLERICWAYYLWK